MTSDLATRVRDAYEHQAAIPEDAAYWTAEIRELCETGTPTVLIYVTDFQGRRASEKRRFVIRLGYATEDGRKLALVEHGSELHHVSTITRHPAKIAREIAERLYGKGTPFQLA